MSRCHCPCSLKVAIDPILFFRFLAVAVLLKRLACLCKMGFSELYRFEYTVRRVDTVPDYRPLSSLPAVILAHRRRLVPVVECNASELRCFMTHTINHSSPRSPMWVFEENYRLLQQLLPEMEAGGDRYYLAADDGAQALEVLILERAPYTTFIELSKPFLVDGVWMPDLSMKLRIYHDAGVVEVVGYQGCHRIPARYEVKNHGPYQRDEKRQVNLLLYELLRYCRRNFYREVKHPDLTKV